MVSLPDVCAIGSLTTAAKCFNCLSISEKRIAIIWFMAQALKALGGVDYTNVNDLTAAAKCFKCESDSALEAFEVAIAQQMSTDAGADSVTISQLKSALKCWCLDPKAVYSAKVFLECQLEQKQKPILL